MSGRNLPENHDVPRSEPSPGVNRRLRVAVAVLAMLGALVIAGTRYFAPARPYTSLSSSADQLRAQFNQDAGRVRIVMLVAPT